MRVFTCVRSEHNHDGALIIAAKDKEEAVQVFGEYENYYNKNPILPTPHDVKELYLVRSTARESGVIYNDYSR